MRQAFYTTYTGVRLPLRLVGPLTEAEINNRNTFILATFDGDDRLVTVHKTVYGEVVLGHQYGYHDNGALKRAEITIHDEDEEITVLEFDEAGAPL
ncbi:MAG: DUF6156 family protein [Magnetospirillum sp.]